MVENETFVHQIYTSNLKLQLLEICRSIWQSQFSVCFLKIRITLYQRQRNQIQLCYDKTKKKNGAIIQCFFTTVQLRSTKPKIRFQTGSNFYLWRVENLQKLEPPIMFPAKKKASQPASTCPKSTIKTLKEGVKYVENEDTRMTPLMSLLLTLNIFDTFFQCFCC